MGMSDLYGPADRAESIATIHAALDAGITLLDTGDFYGMGHNELLLREALAGRPRDAVVLSVKFGALRDARGGWLGVDGRPAAVKNFLAYTLRRLGTDHVDVYRPARLDPAVPIEETVGAIAEMVKAGLRAPRRPLGGGRRHHPPRPRRHPDLRPADRVLAGLARDRGRDPAHLARARDRHHRLRRPLARPPERALVEGPRAAAQGDFRAWLPRFGGENLEQNLALVEALRALAREKGTTVAALAIAWVLSRGEDIVPLVGARRRDQLAESLGALEVRLTADDLARIEEAVPQGRRRGRPLPDAAHGPPRQRATLGLAGEDQAEQGGGGHEPRRARAEAEEQHRAHGGDRPPSRRPRSPPARAAR